MILHAGKATLPAAAATSLYDFNLATYDEGDRFDQSQARGFIELWHVEHAGGAPGRRPVLTSGLTRPEGPRRAA